MKHEQNTKVTENDIVASLKPLADEFFSGKISAEDNIITYVTETGQTFQITVTQI